MNFLGHSLISLEIDEKENKAIANKIIELIEDIKL